MADDVQVKICQQDIIRLDLEIKALIQDVRECNESLDLLQEFNQEIQSKVLDLKEKIGDLETLGREQDRQTDTIGILKEAEKHRKQLSSMQVELRRANLSSQMAIDKRNKERLFQGASTGTQKGISSKEQAARSASNVTEHLMSVSRRMAAQVVHSQDTINTLATSSQQVDQTHDEFKNMAGHIHHSRKLLTRYGRRECTDKILILLAMIFFFATVLYIMKKRLLSSADAPEPSVS